MNEQTDRRASDEKFNVILGRLDEQDKALATLATNLSDHVKTESALRPTLEELVTLWRASRILGAMLAVGAVIVGGMFATFDWVKAHIR